MYEKGLRNRMGNLTVITALYDLGRGEINDSFKRPYQHYKDKFKELCAAIPDTPLVIFCSKNDQEYMESVHPKEKTYIIYRELAEFRTWFEFFDNVQTIRQKPTWRNQADWLPHSPQAALEYYNPLVLSKLFLVNDVTFINPFQTEYFLWLDAGITSTIHPGYFSHDKVLEKITTYLDPFLFVSYPYIGSEEIHGFERPILHSLSKVDYVSYVCRGGLFGGKKQTINLLNGSYYNLLRKTLNEGYMGTEESLFTILAHLYPQQINRFLLDENGLISKFCEHIKNKNVVFEQPPITPKKFIGGKVNKANKDADTSIYVLTYNFPEQFKLLLESFIDYPEFLLESRKICIDNSTDLNAIEELKKICKQYGFEYVSTGSNLGICGGRKFAANHFKNSSQKYYIFFEDDMLMARKGSLPCKCGFLMYIPDLYKKIKGIMDRESFDFLKLSFSEFYMDNSVAVPWFNVPQEVREKLYPENPQKLDTVPPPRTKFNEIRTYLGLSYILGDIFFCNWPIIISKEGNRKIFFDPEYAHPFEQTIMSHAIQKTKKGELVGACLLASTIDHDRVYHYDAALRKEC